MLQPRVPPSAYPLMGASHLWRRPKLRRKVLGFLGGITAASVAGIAGLAHFTYSKQLAVVGRAVGVGLMGKLTTMMLILGEASLPLYLAAQHSLHMLQSSLFTEVLSERGALPVRPLSRAERQEINSYLNLQAEKRAQERAKRQSLGGLVSYVVRHGALHLVTSPLTSVVPFAPLLFAVSGGHSLAAPYMAPFLRMKGLASPEEQQAVIEHNRARYRQFGITVGLLNSIPVLSWSFCLSNSVGAALWAAELERQQVPLWRTASDNGPSSGAAPPEPAPAA